VIFGGFNSDFWRFYSDFGAILIFGRFRGVKMGFLSKKMSFLSEKIGFRSVKMSYMLKIEKKKKNCILA
jgi:hypothetical protein